MIDLWILGAKPQTLAELEGDRHTILPNRQMPLVIAYSDSCSDLPYLIGYEAQNLFEKSVGHATHAAYPGRYNVEHARLLLYESEHTNRSRTELIATLDEPKEAGIIDENHDAIRG